MTETIQHKHIRLKTGSDYRMVIISDIHGHAAVFQDLLNKVELKTDDYLVILGDFVNRGSENMVVLESLMSLSKRPRTYIMKGNHESFVTNYVNSEDDFGEMLAFLKEDPYVLVLHEMAKIMNFDLYTCQDSEVFRQLLLQNFKNEMDFMEDRAVILENESFVFVHAGYEKSFSPVEDEGKLVKYDFFNDHSPVQDKTVIVGHWPSSNLRLDKVSNLPFFNDEKNIITIDGGLGVKSSGELNAFIITSKGGEILYDTLQSNTFEERVITQRVELPKEELVLVNYPHFDVEILERNYPFTTCRHHHSGKTFSVFDSLLYKEEDKNYIKIDYNNQFFDLQKGNQIQVCMTFDDCIQVKYDNEFGWILPVQIK